MTDANLRKHYERILADRAPSERTSCVAPELLRGILEGETPEAERVAALRHVASCSACMRDLEFLRSVVYAGRRLRHRHTAILSLAASIVLLVAGGSVWRVALRSGAGPDVMRGSPERVALIAPIGEASLGDSVVFVWSSLPGALQYHLEVADPDGASVLQASTPDTTLSISGARIGRQGIEYGWWVQVDLADGTRPRSGVGRFRFTAP